MVTLSVANVGAAIASVDLERIFEQFYRVDAHRSRGSGGTGPGLAIVHSIFNMHEGAVIAASGLDGRTMFRLRFPLI